MLTQSQDEEKIKLKGEVTFPSYHVLRPLHPYKINLQVHRLIAPRDQKHQSNFVEFRSLKIVYRRYAGLFFCVCVDANDNELAYLEAIHFFVEVLDSFFGNVCELDLVFNFYKVSEESIPRAENEESRISFGEVIEERETVANRLLGRTRSMRF